MAMLAERKRKVKWCLNPRGNDWSKDENKFGQRMLEKMGWEPGTGLGAKRQGRTDFIRIQIKNDTKGLGNKEKLDENWTRQQQSFDDLLAELNGTIKNEDSINISSLEDKSRKSRARVHYHKFTRGKDVSKYSSKDLNSIIGVGGKQAKEESEESTETSSNSMYDYFKNKMSNQILNNEESYTEITDSYDYATENNDIEESQNICDNVEHKKRKKKTKRKTFEDEENVEQNTFGNDDLEQLEIPIKKKKKKKNKIVEDIVEENNVIEKNCQGVETNLLEDSIIIAHKSLKKKKKHHKKLDSL